MALKIKVLKVPTKKRDCGSAESEVKWVLDPGDTGWIIQRIDWSHDVLKCDGTADTDLSGAKDCGKKDIPQFWEAWKVDNGKVFIGRSTDEHGSDTYATANHPSRKNKHSISGKVQFVSGYNLTVGTGADDWQENEIPPAGNLPTRKTQPTGWDAASARDHNMEIEWNCCVNPPNTPTVTGQPTTSDSGSGERIRRLIPYDVSPSARRVATLLSGARSWVDLPDTPRARDALVKSLRQVVSCHTDVIRGGMEFFIHEAKRKKAYSLDAQARLYLVNRLLFRLPRYVPLGQIPFFGGWLLPDAGERINAAWPFAVQKGGKLVLTGTFAGYMGDEFRALAEFDYFRRHYRRRQAATRK